MSDQLLQQISETQVLYADAGYDPVTGKIRMLEITRKLSMRKVFEVVSVVPVTVRTEFQGIAVLEFPFSISVGHYRQMVAEAAQGSLALASATFNVSMDLAIHPEPLESNMEDTSTSGVQKRGSVKEVAPDKRFSVNEVGDNRETGAKGKNK